MRTAAEVLPTWPTDTIAEAIREAAIDTELLRITELAGNLNRTYRGRIADLDSRGLESLLTDYQRCVQALQRLTSYAELGAAGGVLEAQATAALSRCDQAWAELIATLNFVEPELAAISAEAAAEYESLAPGGDLHNFHHRVVRANRQGGETAAVLAKLRPTGRDGWRTLARQLLGRIQVSTPGGTTGIGGVMPRLYRPDRAERRQAQQSITAALAGELDLRATVLSMIVSDGLARAELVGASWLDETLTADQLTKPEIDALVAGAAAGYPLVHEYYQLKAALLGVDCLDEADRYAPVGLGNDDISWAQAVELVLTSFDGVHPRFGAAARQLLAEGRVDASSRPGKAAHPFTKDVSGELPWISVNFNGSLRQVLLLAHELGHGVHMMMAGELPLLAAATPRVLAETVALFFESATLTHLQRLPTSRHALAALTARWIEDQAVTICRHAAIFEFEADLRNRWSATGRLDALAIGRLWLESQRRLYGPGLNLSDGFAGWWSYLDGLFLSPGSTYTHLYGQFAAAALAEQYAVAGAGFGDRLLALMKAGGSAPPRELLLLAGVDPLDPATWQAGLAALGRRLATLRTTLIEADQGFQGRYEPSETQTATSPGRR